MTDLDRRRRHISHVLRTSLASLRFSFVALWLVFGLAILPGARADEPTATAAAAADDAAPKPPAATTGAGRVPERLQVYDEISVTERADDMVGVADSAAQGVTGRSDLQARPILRPGELLETVPGVIITQHAGGGKANQYFLRGFNLDHGTDFGITVDDMPVNMPSHGHGQGYSDLNFTIPELVESVRYEKGPYDAAVGDFSAAGSAAMRYVDELPKGLLQLSSGSDGYARALVADSMTVGNGTLLGALEWLHNDGPWRRPDDYRKGNALLRYHRGDATTGFTLTAMGYDGTWDSSDQIARRAVAAGLVDRLGTLDTTTGGDSSRASLSGEWHRGDERTLTSASAYLLHYRLDLFSNFTYFLDDPEHGDQFEQVDRRTVGGFRAEHQWRLDTSTRDLEATVGVQTRWDDIHNGLFHTAARRRLATTREDDITQISGAPYAQLRATFAPWLRAVGGLRYDAYRFQVTSDNAGNSGREMRGIASPKLSLAFGPWHRTELYLNFGQGFHSNDARGTTIRIDPATGALVQRVSPLVRATGYDVGVRTSALRNVQIAVTVFDQDLDSELVFSGDAGSTEAGRPSRRRGLEVQSFFHLTRWLQVDADYAHSRSRFRDADPVGNRIPGSIEDALSMGVTVSDWHGAYGSVRLRYFGPRPLIEDDSVRSRASSLVNLDAGYRFGNGLRVGLEVFNLLDARVSDIDYFYASRLPGEPPTGVEDVHFHPAEPRALRLVAGWAFR